MMDEELYEETEDPFSGQVGDYDDEGDEDEIEQVEETDNVARSELAEEELAQEAESTSAGGRGKERPDYDRIIEETKIRFRDELAEGDEMRDLMEFGKYTYLPVYSYTLGHISLDSFSYDVEDLGVEGMLDEEEVDLDTIPYTRRELEFDDERETATVKEIKERSIGVPETLGETGKRFTWWEDDSLMDKYPYIFINPVITSEYMTHVDNIAYHLLRTRPGEQFVLTDSGGFQMVSRPEGQVMDNPGESVWDEAKINPTDLARWQYENADAGMILDMPPYGKSSKDDVRDADNQVSYTEWREGIYEERLARTAQNSAEMHQAWNDLDTEGFYRMGVLQGQPDQSNSRYQYEPLDTWRETLEETGTFDGWSLKPRPIDDADMVSFFLGYAASELQEYDYIHVLQLGNLPMKMLCMFYGKETGQWITSDAGSWAAATLWRQVFEPDPVNHSGMSNVQWPQMNSRTVTISPRSDEEREGSDQDATRFDMYPCRCKVCQIVENEKGIGYITEDDSDSRRNASLCLHNLQQILQSERVLQSLMRAHWDTLLEDIEIRNSSIKAYGNEFWHVLSTLVSDNQVRQIHRGMEYIRMCHEDGAREANRHRHFDWYQKGKEHNPAVQADNDITQEPEF